MKTKEATHTPGPWTNNDSYDSVLGADGEVVCHTFGAVDPVDRLNAKLIAAAPEMLDALIEAKQWLHDFYPEAIGDPNHRRVRDAYWHISEVVAKATGQEEE